MRTILFLTALLIGWAGTTANQSAWAEPPAKSVRFDGGVISGLGARAIGPARMSGRISALDARVVDGKTLIYVASASGGVWRSEDDGTTFEPVFDKQPVQSIGAVTIDPKNHETIWIGTGEPWTRNSVSYGDGIYKSTDGGQSWTHMGLRYSERIVKILVHPKDSNTVYACVPGKLWSDSSERGVFKTSDGGKSWKKILKGKNLSTGCSGLTMAPGYPHVMYAGMWDFRRKGWTFRSGGEGPKAKSGSGLYRSLNGGKTWKELKAGKRGLPPKPYGRIEVVFAPSTPKVVYAFIEGVDSALYRSDNSGKTWEKRDKSQWMVWRPFYFAKLIVDPTNPERIFKPNLALIVSDDGGKSFSSANGGAHGDWHDVWINPANPKHIIGGDDAGIWISRDGGSKWALAMNLPLSQFYHVSVDDQDPYQVYGGLQDNTSWVGDSDYPGGITNSRWEAMLGGDGFWVFADPSDPDYIYAETQGGFISHINRRTRAARDIQPKAGYGEKLRFNWNTPIHLSPNRKDTVYTGAQYLFRTRNQGQSWERISPDLTTNDPKKQQQELSGGITVDNSAAEAHTTIFTISESPKNGKVIWVGTDDGNVQLTRNGGKSWTNVVENVKGLAKHSWVSWIEASRFDAATAYAAFDRHTFGDMTPYVYKTTDYGKTWKRIAMPKQGIRGFVYVIKEDAVEPDLLFLGTELGLWITVDGGKRWAEFKGGNFPAVSVRDIALQERENDLVLGTHGRGIWIIDDITPLRSLTPKVLQQEAAFLKTRPASQRIVDQGGWPEGDATFIGQRAPNGVQITYYQQKRHLFGPLKIEIFGPDGKLVDKIPASKRRGINRVSWSMRVKPPRVPKAAQLAFSASQGPRVVPGTYTVRLTKGKNKYETKIKIGLDRRAKFSLKDRKVQFDTAMRVHGMFGQMSAITDKIFYTTMMAQQYAAKLPKGDALTKQFKDYMVAAAKIRQKIVATKEGGAITGEERIREHTDQLYGAIMSYEGRPAKYQVKRIDALARELDDVTKEFDALLAKTIPEINKALKAKGLPPIGPPKGMKPKASAQVSSADLNDAFATFLGRQLTPRVRITRGD